MIWQLPTWIIIAVLGLFANGIILFSIIKYKVLRKNNYSYLVSLAVCDSMKVIVMINIIVYTHIDSYRQSACMETGIAGFTLLCCTTFHLAAESINRCLHVVWPYEYARILKNQKSHVYFVVACLWLLPLIFGIVTPLIWFKEIWFERLQLHAKIFGCDSRSQNFDANANSESYVILMYVIFFAAPLLIMVVSYGMVLRTSYAVAQKMRKTEVKKQPVMTSPAVRKTKFSNPVIEMVSATYSTSVMSEDLALKDKIEHRSERAMSIANAQRELKRKLKHRKREIKSSKTVLIMISAFIICNAPISTLVWFSDGYDNETAEILLRAFLTLSQIQVFVNPLVYFLRLRDFKDARKKCKTVSRTIIRKTMRL